MADEDLVEAWKLCDGWMHEFCIIIRDHFRDGEFFPAPVDFYLDAPPYPGPMPLQYIDVPPEVRDDDGNYIRPDDEGYDYVPELPPAGSFAGPTATRQTWELLVQMFGYTTENNGEIYFEPDLIKPILLPLEITDRLSMDNRMHPQGHFLEFASYCAAVMGLIE